MSRRAIEEYERTIRANCSMRYYHEADKETKLVKLLELREEVLRLAGCRPNAVTVFIERGLRVHWARIPVSGGVGCIWWLPRHKVWRMQIGAARWPWVRDTRVWQGGVPYVKSGKKGWKYGWVLEI